MDGEQTSRIPHDDLAIPNHQSPIILQEVITLVVFVAFATLYLNLQLRWNHYAAFGCILGAVAFTFLPRS